MELVCAAPFLCGSPAVKCCRAGRGRRVDSGEEAVAEMPRAEGLRGRCPNEMRVERDGASKIWLVWTVHQLSWRRRFELVPRADTVCDTACYQTLCSAAFRACQGEQRKLPGMQTMEAKGTSEHVSKLHGQLDGGSVRLLVDTVQTVRASSTRHTIG